MLGAKVTQFPLAEAFNHNVDDDPFVNNIKNLIQHRLLSDLKWKVVAS